MKTHYDEFPKHPLPHIPQQPPEPERPRVQQPMVYVYEPQRWEYKVITKNATDDPSLSSEELNAHGDSGWELVGVVPLPNKVQFYFKRIRS